LCQIRIKSLFLIKFIILSLIIYFAFAIVSPYYIKLLSGINNLIYKLFGAHYYTGVEIVNSNIVINYFYTNLTKTPGLTIKFSHYEIERFILIFVPLLTLMILIIKDYKKLLKNVLLFTILITLVNLLSVYLLSFINIKLCSGLAGNAMNYINETKLITEINKYDNIRYFILFWNQIGKTAVPLLIWITIIYKYLRFPTAS